MNEQEKHAASQEEALEINMLDGYAEFTTGK